MIHAHPRPDPAVVTAKIDTLIGGGALQSPIALTVASVLRRLAEIAAAQTALAAQPPVAGLVSNPPPTFDWGAASDGCVEGGGFGGLGGAELGGPWGAAGGALGGCLVGGLIKGFGHGWLSQSSGTTSGSTSGTSGAGSGSGTGGSGKR